MGRPPLSPRETPYRRDGWKADVPETSLPAARHRITPPHWPGRFRFDVAGTRLNASAIGSAWTRLWLRLARRTRWRGAQSPPGGRCPNRYEGESFAPIMSQTIWPPAAGSSERIRPSEPRLKLFNRASYSC